jgi:7,8-dihydropterin-6-yl-methyl-4-(beta-D-ribofuranosyl)aminobenzene 5'-phosphate synthase
MKLTVLTENVAGGKFFAEHGLSYYIEHDRFSFLFDTGHSDNFIKNARMLGLDVQNNIDTIVLSHGHWDHGDGLRFLEDKTLICHPGAFIKRYRKNDKSDIGLASSKSELTKKYKLITTEKPYEITKNIIFLGEIPRLNDFEAQSTSFVDEKGEADFVMDDSAIAIIQNNELIVVTGCSHSGICNIVEHAKTVSGIRNVKAVIGGFHLKHNNLQLLKTIEYLKEANISEIYPSHCTELPALCEFHKSLGIKQLKTGMILEF